MHAFRVFKIPHPLRFQPPESSKYPFPYILQPRIKKKICHESSRVPTPHMSPPPCGGPHQVGAPGKGTRKTVAAQAEKEDATPPGHSLIWQGTARLGCLYDGNGGRFFFCEN